MKIPHIIRENTRLTYKTSPASFALVGESDRSIKAEDFNWDDKLIPSLRELCLKSINKNFEHNSIFSKLPCEEKNYLLENFDSDLPLELMIPLIDEKIYWQRRYKTKFEKVILNKNNECSWKSLYIERYIQDMLEQAAPEHQDEDEMTKILTLCAPYIQHMKITQLQCWKPPLTLDVEDLPEMYPIDHINFNPILNCLYKIVEFDLVFGMNNVADAFGKNMFNLSILDCQRLSKALNYLRQLKILKIHRSKLDDSHIRALMQNFIKNETVEELDLSHCCIRDQGALCIAKVLIVHPTLISLSLCNNQIQSLGCEGIGFALLKESCNLKKLNLKLNPLKAGGAMGLFRALVRDTKLTHVSLAACQYNDNAPLRTGQMLLLNKSLKWLDVSNNWFDKEGGQALVEGLSINTTLEWLDVRETDITFHQKNLINKYIRRNRLHFEDLDESLNMPILSEQITLP